MPEQNKGRAKKSSEMERIKRELRKLAFGKANDCVKLALCEDVDIASLDLSLLTEIRKSEKGSVELKLMDRSKVLEQLAGMADQGDERAERVLEALAEGHGRWSLTGFRPSSCGLCVVDAAQPGQRLRGDRLRRRGAVGKDAQHGTGLFPVGDVPL